MPDGWVEWAGGPRPVGEDAIVDIKHYDGDATLTARAGDMCVEGPGGFDWWAHHDSDFGPDGFVVAYRVVDRC